MREEGDPSSFLGKKEIRSKPRRRKGIARGGRRHRPTGNSREARSQKLRISDRGRKSAAGGRENSEK
jgi:hypothetical protein